MSGRTAPKKKKGNLSPDIVVKNYWNRDEEFADLFNAVLFGGEEVIRSGELAADDMDSSTLQEHRGHTDFVRGARDNIRICRRSTVFGVRLSILGLEHQEHIHYAMPVRVMGYDYITYKKQYDRNARGFLEKRKKGNAEPVTEEEYLSGMRRTDRFAPVVTVVIYYGEKPWDGAMTLHEMLDIPAEMERYVNDYRMILVEARQNDLVFHNANNRDLFHLFGVLLDRTAPNKDRRRKFTEYCETHKTGREVLLALAGATNTKLDYSAFIGKEANSVSTFFDEIAREGEARGETKGKEKVNSLNIRLAERGRNEDIVRAAEDPSFQKQLFQEFGL